MSRGSSGGGLSRTPLHVQDSMLSKLGSSSNVKSIISRSPMLHPLTRAATDHQGLSPLPAKGRLRGLANKHARQQISLTDGVMLGTIAMKIQTNSQDPTHMCSPQPCRNVLAPPGASKQAVVVASHTGSGKAAKTAAKPCTSRQPLHSLRWRLGSLGKWIKDCSHHR